MKKILFSLLFLAALGAKAQEKVGDKWVDNNLKFKITEQTVKTNGILTYCIADIERDLCIENLQTGFELKVYDAADKLLWEGIGSGRTRVVKLPEALPNASYITISAFKPFVINKRTGNRIHQDEPIQTKFTL